MRMVGVEFCGGGPLDGQRMKVACDEIRVPMLGPAQCYVPKPESAALDPLAFRVGRYVLDFLTRRMEWRGTR